MHATGDDFNFPKLHSLLHYFPSITEIGTTDNCNTETTERLHIDYAKDAYRASNKKEFIVQMIIWLTRLEKIERHIIHVQWREGLDKPAPTEPTLHLQLTKNPSAKAVTIQSLSTSYHAPAFTSSLQSFLQRFMPHQSSPSYTSFTTIINNLDTLRVTFPVWHRIRIVNHSIQDVEGVTDRTDAVQAVPERKNRKTKDMLPERFDTVLIDEKGNADVAGISGECFGALPISLGHVDLTSLISLGLRVAQVRVIFKLSDDVLARLFGTTTLPFGHLLYVEWFSRPAARPEKNHNMYKVKRSVDVNQREYAIIELTSLRRSYHLFPRFGKEKVADSDAASWTSASVLDKCDTFYINNFVDMHAFQTIF